MRNVRRRTFVLLMIQAFSSSWLYPSLVSKTQAETVALNWVKLENNLKHLRLNKSDIRISTVGELTYRETPIGYIVDLEPTGFILVPSVSELAPVKFISFSGDYNACASHPFIETLKYRMYYAVAHLGYSRGTSLGKLGLTPGAMDLNQKERNEAAWERLLGEDLSQERRLTAYSAVSVTPMLTSTWNQLSPYNALCPELNGQRCVTGCLATAQAQVMYYWKYPATGQGVNSYWWGNGEQYLSADFGHEYVWDLMVDSYSGSESQEQIDAVAGLMLDIGIARDMNYGLSGSFTAPNRNNSLVSFFRYSQDLRYVQWADYSSWAEWFNVFKDQMDHGWPVLLSILGEASGNSHFVVVDGYRVEAGVNQVHVNMGWGGMADNYYSMDNIYGMGNRELDSALINIYPPDCANTGDIRGSVSDGSGNPIQHVHIKIYDEDNIHLKSAWTDGAGTYAAECLKEGTYKVFFDASQAGNYRSVWYNGQDAFDAADVVPVTAGNTTTGVNAVLGKPVLKGKVTDISGNGIANVRVCAFYQTGIYAGCLSTDDNGDYAFMGLKTDLYTLRFSTADCSGTYALEWYNDKDSFETADPVSVVEGQTFSAIDVVLENGGTIRGRVTNSAGEGLDDCWFTVYTSSGGTVTDHVLHKWDGSGCYEVKSLKGGSYKIYFNAAGTQGRYISEWYDDKESLETADLVSVTAGSATEGIDAVLSSTIPLISGKVMYASGVGLAGATMAFSNGGVTATTDLKGVYAHNVSVGWSGTVTPSKTGYTFEPSSRSYSNVTSDQVHQDYTAETTTSDDEPVPKKGGCFIATACYGTPMAEEVKTLSLFRDQYMMTSPLGRAFVGVYYTFGPLIADYIRDKEDLKSTIRELLEPIVWLVGRVVDRPGPVGEPRGEL